MVKAINNNKSMREMVQGAEGNISAEVFAPRSDWSEMSESDHFVQFYEADTFLLNSLSGFISAGISAGEAVIVVATEEHRESLDEMLHGCGLDMIAARASGQYVLLDASDTLSKFMVDGWPQPELFAEVIGSIIAQAAENWHRVRIFGEMVALLWAEGNKGAAIHLEELWNKLGKNHHFSLFCGYPINGFDGEALAHPLSEVCAGHSRVIPAESYTALTSTDDRLRTITALQQKARSLEYEIAKRKQELEEREQLFIREQMARAEAETANRMKDEFLATVSHELRTPLNAIIGWSHMLRKRQLDEASVAQALETIERNAKSQAQLVEDILDVSRVITGKLRLNIGPVDVASVINTAIDCVQLAAGSKRIRLEVTLDPSARQIAGDSGRLQQVVWNLLSNAIKFTPSGGRVEVRLERAGSNAQIRVSDTGQGISADFLPFIFDRFRQADSTSTRRHGGLGLGLAIVRHLVELHGGTVHAESGGEGRGSTFAIKLPLAMTVEGGKSRRRKTESLRPNEDSSARLEPLPSLDGVQVLLVDDDKDTLEILSVMLTEYRANVHAVSSAAEALEAIKWFKPDVLVSDLAMPSEDGCSLIGKVRALESESDRHIPALALTAYVRVEDRARALSAGFNMFVPKPIELNELITAIWNLSESSTTEFEQT